MLPQIYCDMDQVLVDFLGGAKEVLGVPYNDKNYWMQEASDDKKKILRRKAPNLFENLDWMGDGRKLWNYILEHSPKILSACPSWMPDSNKQKESWINQHLNIGESQIHLVKRAEKRRYAINESGQPNILIDDHSKNIGEWQAAGGIGILHQSAESTIEKLKKMGF